MPELEYDREADCAYVQFSGKEHYRSVQIDETRYVDYAADGTVIGIELLYVTGGVDIDGLPFTGQVRAILQKNGIEVAQ